MKFLSQNNSLSDQLMTPPRYQGSSFYIPSHGCGILAKSLGPDSPSARAASNMLCRSSGTFGKGLLCQETEQNLCQYFMYQKNFSGGGGGWECPFTLPFFSLLSRLAWPETDDKGEDSWV